MTAIRFEAYKPRKIQFWKLLKIDEWHVKIYTLTNKKTFQSFRTLDRAIAFLPEWLQHATKSPRPTYHKAFLIVHEAREGVWLLLNWWTGGEMIETRVYFAGDVSENPDIQLYPGALVCIWELEIFAHERKAWIKYVLSNTGIPNFEAYLKDIIQT